MSLFLLDERTKRKKRDTVVVIVLQYYNNINIISSMTGVKKKEKKERRHLMNELCASYGPLHHYDTINTVLSILLYCCRALFVGQSSFILLRKSKQKNEKNKKMKKKVETHFPPLRLGL